jgi:hypothetical protein
VCGARDGGLFEGRVVRRERAVGRGRRVVEAVPDGGSSRAGVAVAGAGGAVAAVDVAGVLGHR